MKRFCIIFFTVAFCSIVDISSWAQLRMLDKYDIPQEDVRVEKYQEEAIKITGKNGVIYIRTPRRVQVTVYTILGQAVMVRMVNPGLSELRVENRGVYLVRVEGRTQKVAL